MLRQQRRKTLFQDLIQQYTTKQRCAVFPQKDIEYYLMPDFPSSTRTSYSWRLKAFVVSKPAVSRCTSQGIVLEFHGNLIPESYVIAYILQCCIVSTQEYTAIFQRNLDGIKYFLHCFTRIANNSMSPVISKESLKGLSGFKGNGVESMQH